MSYCPNCGTQVNENAVFCSNCGTRLKNSAAQNNGGYGYDKPQYVNPSYSNGVYGQPKQYKSQPDGGRLIFGVIGFLFPLLGIILWIVWKGDREGDAKRAGKGALISIILTTVLIFVCLALTVVGVFTGSTTIVYDAVENGKMLILPYI